MSIPANDAFTLNSRSHSNAHRRRTPSISRRALTRSPSPKIPFSTALDPSPNSNDVRATKRKPLRRLSSNGSITFISEPTVDGSEALGTLHEVADIATPVLPHSQHSPKQQLVEVVQQQRQKIDWEVPRKVLHSSIGFLVLPLYISHTPVRHVTYALSAALTVVVTADVIRLRYPSFARLYERFLGFLMRESEKQSLNGVVWYLLGAIIVLSFYPIDIAVVSILTLSWCDTAASTFGRMYGRYTSPLPRSVSLPVPLLSSIEIPIPFAKRKSTAGFIAACVTGSLVSAAFWGWIAPLGVENPSWAWDVGLQYDPVAALSGSSASVQAFLGTSLGLSAVCSVVGVIAGLGEALDVGSMDDNLTLPVIAGGAIWGFFELVKWWLS